jgi:hypothetical protein
MAGYVAHNADSPDAPKLTQSVVERTWSSSS